MAADPQRCLGSILILILILGLGIATTSTEAAGPAPALLAIRARPLLKRLFSRPPAPRNAISTIHNMSGQSLDLIEHRLLTEDFVGIKRLPFHKRFLTFGSVFIGQTSGGYEAIIKPAPDGPIGADQSLPRYEVAAYRLSRMLDLSLVPPTVLRTMMIDGKATQVSVQLRIRKVKSYSSTMGDLVRMLLHPKNPDPYDREAKRSRTSPKRIAQLNDLFLLNFLGDIHDRHGRNTLVDQQGNLVAVDNGMGFATVIKGLTKRPGLAPITLTARTARKLNQIVSSSRFDAMKDVLTRSEMDALQQRLRMLLR